MKHLIYFDGVLYCSVALFMYLSSQMGTDEAAKYVAPETLFWTRLVLGGISAVLFSLKMYRSTAYADERSKREAQEKLANVTDVKTLEPEVK